MKKDSNEKDTGLEQRIKNTAALLRSFAAENLSEKEAEEVINALPADENEE